MGREPAASPENLTAESIYSYYKDQLLPALLSSLPLLFRQLTRDAYDYISSGPKRFFDFVWPKFSHPPQLHLPHFPNATLPEVLLRHLDVDGDGVISSAEWLRLTDHLSASSHSWWLAVTREWPLLEWKLGIYVWRTFGGLILVLAVLSIIPGRLHGWAARVLRWPVLGLTYFLIAMELAVYVIIRLFIRLAEFAIARPKHRALRRRMMEADSYEEWYEHASNLDESQQRDRWLKKIDDDSSYRYNWGFIKELLKDMRQARRNGDSLLALAVIQQCTRKNVGGVMSEDLFAYSNTGQPKEIVAEFIREVVRTLRWITDEALRVEGHGPGSSEQLRAYEDKLQQQVRGEKDKLWKALVDSVVKQQKSGELKSKGSFTSDSDASPPTSPSRPPTPELPPCHREQVLAFLKRARAAYGRTALCLSGGAMMGLYHFGVVTALVKAGLLPHIISGTSAGSVVGAILCTRTDEELVEDLRPEVLWDKLTCFERPWRERLRGVWNTGNLFLESDWLELIRWFTKDDMTFLEAYRRTGKIFCITLSSTSKKSPPVLLNYLSAPNVTIASAVIASAAVPGFISPVRLRVKDENGTVRNQGGKNDQTFWDGSIQQDLPTKGLAEMLNCQFFIAAQCNPHIVPFFFNPKGGVGMPSRWSSGTQEDSWRGGFLLAALEMYLKNDMKAKFVFLKDVEASIGFTSTMLTQDFLGSTTIVPRVRFVDFFKLFSNPLLPDLQHYFRAGQIAAYGHLNMISLHYSIADVLDECVAKLESGKRLSDAHRHDNRRSTNDKRTGAGPRSSLDSQIAQLWRNGKFEAPYSAGSPSDTDDDEYESF